MRQNKKSIKKHGVCLHQLISLGHGTRLGVWLMSPVTLRWRKPGFPFSQLVSITVSWLGWDFVSILPSAGILPDYNLCTSCACCHSLQSSYAHQLCLGDCSLGVPHQLWLLQPFCLLIHIEA